MFMLSWRDDGLVGIGLPLVCLGLSGIVLGDISHPAMTMLLWGLLLAGSPVLWWLGNQLNGDADSGEEPHPVHGPVAAAGPAAVPGPVRAVSGREGHAMSQDAYQMYRRNRFRAVSLFACLAGLIGFLADVMDRHALTGGIPATVTRASTFITQANHWFDSGDGQLDVRITPDSGSAFVHPLVLSRRDIDHLLADGSVRITYVADRPARHWREGEPLPAMVWYLLVLAGLFGGLFVLSLRAR